MNKDNHFKCEKCNKIYHEDFLEHYRNYGYICDFCSGSYDLMMDNYGTPSKFINHSINGEIKYSPTIGIELETERTNKCLKKLKEIIYNNNHYFYCQYDDSLNNYGVEIVSHPATFEWIEKNWNLWKSICDLRNDGMISYNSDNCGCHVHISKKDFPCFDIFKLHKFFMNESDFIFKISQRKSLREMNRWAEVDYNPSRFIEILKNDEGNAKYSAINLCHEKTIEFRIFKGTLIEDSLKKNIQFVHALWRFVKENSLQDMRKENFINFISNKPFKKNYRELISFIENKC